MNKHHFNFALPIISAIALPISSIAYSANPPSAIDILNDKLQKINKLQDELNKQLEELRTKQSEIGQQRKQLEEQLTAQQRQTEAREAKLSTQVQELQQKVDALQNRKPSPPNILVNSDFMVPTDAKNPNGIPAGWFIHGTGTANSVSKFTKGFVGIYADSKAATYLNPSDANSATESSPVYYNPYDTGPRIGRDGWRTADYKLVNFKSGPAGGFSVLCQSRPQSIHDQHSTYHFQMYVKFISGSRFGISQDVGATTTISRGDCDQSPQGWCKFEGEFYGSQTDNAYLCMGRPAGSSEDVEVLIALPYIYSQNALWVDSVDTVPTPTP